MNATHLNTPLRPTAANILRWLVKTVFSLIILAAALFTSAGSLTWLVGWRYLAVMFLVQFLNAVVLIPLRPDLIAERSRAGENTEPWDRWLSVGVALVGPLLMVIAGGLDERFGGTGGMIPVWAQALGLALVVLSGVFGLWAMVENGYFAATARIQAERGQTVVSSGPYAWVRHPGYLGSLLFALFTPLALGSAWAYTGTAAHLAMLVLRTAKEDAMLREKLDGYAGYARRVPWRLLPGIW